MVSDNTQCPFQCVGSHDAVLVGRVCVCVFFEKEKNRRESALWELRLHRNREGGKLFRIRVGANFVI